MPGFLFHLPLTVAGLLIIAALCFYSVAGIALTRRFILPQLKVSEHDSEFTGALIQAIMVFYGLAVALVAVSVWETHSEVSGTVSQEASRLASLYRDVSGYALFLMDSAAFANLNRTGGWEVGASPSLVIVDEGKAASISNATIDAGTYAFFFNQRRLMGGLGLQGSKITRIHPPR